jgi:hypothetical protein
MFSLLTLALHVDKRALIVVAFERLLFVIIIIVGVVAHGT